MLEHEGWSCERRLPNDGPVRDAFTSVLRETVSLLTTQEGASVRLGMRTPESGANSRERTNVRAPPARRPTPKLAGDWPKERRAPTQRLDRCRLRYFLTSTSTTACPRSVRGDLLRRVGDQLVRLPFCLLEVVAYTPLACLRWWCLMHFGLLFGFLSLLTFRTVSLSDWSAMSIGTSVAVKLFVRAIEGVRTTASAFCKKEHEVAEAG